MRNGRRGLLQTPTTHKLHNTLAGTKGTVCPSIMIIIIIIIDIFLNYIWLLVSTFNFYVTLNNVTCTLLNFVSRTIEASRLNSELMYDTTEFQNTRGLTEYGISETNSKKKDEDFHIRKALKKR